MNAGLGILVIKIGGNALVQQDSLQSFADAIKRISSAGYTLIVTHGGGPQITEALNHRGVPSSFKSGYRVSSKEVVEVVKEVLCGEMQERIVAALQNVGINAAGVCGDDGLFLCSKKSLIIDDEMIDLEYVGEIEETNPARLVEMISQFVVPVVSAIGSDSTGNIYNINADTGAASIAEALSAKMLCLLTDVEGVYGNWPDRKSLLLEIHEKDLDELINKVDEGMIPKLEAARSAISSGVQEVLITSGNTGKSLEQRLLNGEMIGTLVRK